MPVEDLISETPESIYSVFSEAIPEQYKPYVILAVYTLIIAIYAIFIWKFYKFLAKRNIIDLDLKKYNRTEHPFWNKFLASVLFLLEYIIIIPILVFFWFSVFSLFLLLLSKSQSVSQILLVSAAIVAAIRLTAYYSGDLSKDLAKIFPFTILAIFLIDQNFFFLSKLIERFSEIPSLFGSILAYLVFIAGLEIFLRFLFLLVDFFRSGEGGDGQGGGQGGGGEGEQEVKEVAV